ncbi:MAG: 4Fe-4S single cluster domain-containing protein [Woeseiaceae bacterium]|nr:4Fe-4S single cluster domain-containing protein [Woeseiaceae bacterium]
MQALRVSRLYQPITSLGFGRRAGIWFQGCSIGCPGCGSKHTWGVEGGEEVTVAQVLSWLSSSSTSLAGVTISGGEPFEQPRALLKLLQQIRVRFKERDDFDVLIYSGYPFRQLMSRHSAMLNQVDALVSGPYLRNRDSAWLRGSVNQEIHTFSRLGEARYGSSASLGQSNSLQVIVDGAAVRIVGIPERGDLAKLEQELKNRGVKLGSSSY